MSSPADSSANNGPSPLLDTPLEIRHHIFSHIAAARDVEPRYTLRYWFEKADIHEQIANNLKNDPDANVTYVAGYNHQYDEDEEPEVQDDAVADDNTENEEDEEQDEEQDEDEDEDNDDENQEPDEDEEDGEEGQDGHDVDAAAEDESNIDNEDEEMHDEQDAIADGATATTNIAHGGTTFTDTIQITNLDQRATEDTGAGHNPFDNEVQSAIFSANTAMDEAAIQHGSENTVEGQGPEQAVHDVDMADTGGNGTTAGDDTAAAAASGPTEPNVILVKPNSKWRHVSKFIRLTQCPPQANLFLISKQFNIEAKQWFYDVATLKIDATASFLHFTFFELALNKLAEAPFSPMENIKNAEITFVWDTTWIRSESTGFAGAVFPVFLKSRADFILEILLRAPELKKVKIHWYDSAQDDGAMQLRADTLEPFILNLRAVVDTEDHYIAPDAKPRAKSRAGKQRLEFKAIIDNGCETF